MKQFIEVERKRELRDGGHEEVEARLMDLGYRPTGSFVEIDTYYSRPDVDYMETVECLRVRHRDGFAEITYKPASDAGTHRGGDVIAKTETNVALRDADQVEAANHLLTAIGMTLLVRVGKARALYRHPENARVVVSIDTVFGAGVFVETEVTAADADGAAKLLNEIERQVGLTTHPVVGLPYRDLVLQAART